MVVNLYRYISVTDKIVKNLNVAIKQKKVMEKPGNFLLIYNDQFGKI